MASNENISGFVDSSVYSDFARLEKVIESAADSFEFLSLSALDCYKSFGQTGTLKELVELSTKSAATNTAVTETVKKQTAGIKELNAERLRDNLSMKERNDLLKLQVAAEAAPAGSIAKVRAEAALLRKELMGLNLEKEKGRQEDIKAQLAIKDAFIKNNVDGYTAQKINIGNYPDLIKQFHALNDEMKQMEATGQKVSPEFEALANKITDVKSAIGSMTSSGNGMTGLSGQLTTVTRQMHELEAEGKKDTAEFHKLVTEAQLLKHAMDGVTAEAKETTKAVTGINDRLKGFGQNIMAMAATYVSFQALQTLIKGSIEEFSQADEAAGRLKNTLQQYDNIQAFTRLAAQSDELAEKFKYLDNDDLNEVFNKLLTYGKLSEDQLNSLLPVIVDFAAKEKVSVTDASETVIKALEGNGKALKVYGVNMKEGATTTERFSLLMSELKPKVDGAAATFAGTFPGLLAKMTQEFKNIQEAIGGFIVKLSGVEEQQLQNAISAGKEAREADKLVTEYEDLSKKVGQTTEDKKRLGDITTSLTGMFGDSVVSINKETGAIELNIEATKNLIKQKLLLNNQEASKYALQYNAAEEGRLKNAEGLTKAQLIYNDAVKRTGITVEQTRDKIAYTKSGNLIDNLTPQEKDIVKLNDNINQYKKELDKFLNAKIEAAGKLRELGFNESDLDSFFSGGNKPITPTGDPDAGNKKTLKDNSLKIELDFQKKAEKIREDGLRVEQNLQKMIVDSDRSTYQERIEAQNEYNNIQAQIDKGAYDAQRSAIETSLNDIDALKKIDKKKRTQEQQDRIDSEKLLLLDLVEVENNYQAVKVAESKKASDSIAAIQQSEVGKRLAMTTAINDNIESQEEDTHAAIKKQYDNGEINYKTYTLAKQKIEEKFQLARLLAQKAYYEAEIKFIQDADPTADVSKMIAALNKIDVEIKKMGIGKPTPKKDRDKELDRLAGQAAQEAFTTAKGFMEAYYDAEIAKQERVLDNINRKRDAELALVDDLMLSDEKKAQRRKEINAQATAQEEQQLKKISEIKKRQAIADRTAAILEITAKTAIAAMHQAGSGDPYTAIARTAVVIGIGLAQVAAVLAKPLPEYRYGTQDHPGGGAILGDGGEREAVYEPGKKPYWSKATSTYYDLAPHTRVVPESQLLADSMGFISSYAPGVHTSITNDFSSLEQATKSGFAELQDTIKNKKEVHIGFNNGQMVTSYKVGNTWIKFLNDMTN